MDPNEFDINLAHAKDGYANAQEVIRFVDSKTGVMTGVLTVTTGIPLAVFHFILSGNSNEGATILGWINQGGVPKWLAWLSASFMLVGFASGVVSIIAATSGLMARRPQKSIEDDSLLKELGRVILKGLTFGIKGNAPRSAQPEVTCLFPFFTPRQRAEARKKFELLKSGGYDRADILREYGLQLESVGSILETKISRNRKAIHCFEGQIAAYAISTVLSVALIVCYPPIPKIDKLQPPDPALLPTWDPTLRGHARTNCSLPNGVT